MMASVYILVTISDDLTASYNVAHIDAAGKVFPNKV
jgi:hypothetical protein